VTSPSDEHASADRWAFRRPTLLESGRRRVEQPAVRPGVQARRTEPGERRPYGSAHRLTVSDDLSAGGCEPSRDLLAGRYAEALTPPSTRINSFVFHCQLQITYSAL
jgi:hypothetical protein